MSCEHDVLKAFLFLGKVDFFVHFPREGVGDPFDPCVSFHSFHVDLDWFKRFKMTLDSLPYKGGYLELLVLLLVHLLALLRASGRELPLVFVAI